MGEIAEIVKSCPFCGSKDIKYSVSHTRIKLPRVAGSGEVVKYKHFYSCNCGACISGSDQFKTLEKWNSRYEDMSQSNAEDARRDEGEK